MNKKWINKSLYLSLLASLLVSTQSIQASQVDVQWLETEKYRDIRAASTNQKRYEERVQKELTEQFLKSAQNVLADNQTLYLEITNLDLAGRIDYDYDPINTFRVVRNIDFPRIEFNYEVRDENNVVLSSGTENIKDMGFLFPYAYPYKKNSTPFYYEKTLINDWFNDTF